MQNSGPMMSISSSHNCKTVTSISLTFAVESSALLLNLTLSEHEGQVKGLSYLSAYV